MKSEYLSIQAVSVRVNLHIVLMCSGEKKVLMSCPSKLTVDAKGRLFVLNQGEKKIQVEEPLSYKKKIQVEGPPN